MQKQDKQGKDVMWGFVEFDEIVQAARCMKGLQARPVSPSKGLCVSACLGFLGQSLLSSPGPGRLLTHWLTYQVQM